MDVAAHLRRFEGSLNSYSGEDPLDLWDKFVEYLERKHTDQGGMWQVFDRLVERFLNVERYANDIRFVNYCIRCASYYAEPAVLFSHVFSRGVGTRTTSFYLAWAQDLERKGLREQADTLYKKAMENQAQPADTLLLQYQMFERRTRVQNTLPGRNPLQDSQLQNQKATLRETQALSELPSKPENTRTIIITSRSETVPANSGASAPTVSAYSAPGLDCDGSELCFEEVRARSYFSKMQEQKKKKEERENGERLVQQAEEAVRQLQSELEEVQHKLEACGNQRGGVAAAPPAGSRPLLHGEDCRGLESCRPLERTANQCNSVPDLEENLNVSQDAAANPSHVTPNTSFGFAGATPSRVLPSPTVNTREALDLIMDMFQAPTLLSETFDGSSFLPASGPTACTGPVGAALTKPTAAVPFTIFQDEGDKENVGVGAATAKNTSRTTRALAPIPVSRPGMTNVTSSDLTPDETTWGAGYNSLHSVAACPNSTSDFAMWAALVSTPFIHKTPISAALCADTDTNIDGEDGAFNRRPSRKLSPIMEQSPAEDWLGVRGPGQQVQMAEILGTTVGKDSAPQCLLASSLSLAPPPAVLSFRDQTLGPCESSRTAGPDCEVYTSSHCDPGNKVHPLPDSSLSPECKPMTNMEDQEKATCSHPVPLSSQSPLRPDWPSVRSHSDLDHSNFKVFMSPFRVQNPQPECADVPMSPEQKSYLCADVPMSPEQKSHLCADVPMSPMQQDQDSVRDVTMSQDGDGTAVHLLEDPWDGQLISDLLAAMTPPLSAHPRCVTWTGCIPNIRPKTTISIGSTSLRVDCVLGEGAFAKVYQARDLLTSEKMVLKVQKPASPWEFYIQTQLDVRLQAHERQLFSRVSSAHMFDNGSVLLGDLHNYGTLLNAINLYKSLSDRVMPQPLVLYFTSCILKTLEILHRGSIVHADVKPDNFMLGQRFVENQCLDTENLDHGLVLIDFGQSIDLRLFPAGSAFTAKCETSGFQCTEMLSGRPWNYQTDLFGIAGTVYCLLFGTYMKVINEGGVWRTNATFRRVPHSELWLDFFHTLLNIPDCNSLPSLCRLHGRVAAVLKADYASKLPSLKARLVVLLLEGQRQR